MDCPARPPVRPKKAGTSVELPPGQKDNVLAGEDTPLTVP